MPSTINVAYTGVVNPANSTPILTRAQLWAGLERKVRRAQDFVKAIDRCTVVSEEVQDDGKNVITREAHFVAKGVDGAVPGQEDKTIKEVCVLFKDAKVDFQQSSGAVITNIISAGPSLQPDDLHMTYVFEWRHPEVEAGSDTETKLVEKHQQGACAAVEDSLKAIRALVEKGEL